MRQLVLSQINGSVFDAASSTQKNQVGRRAILADGREFVYAATAANLAAGDGVKASPGEVALAALSFGTVSAGSNSFNITVSGVTKNQFANGYLFITHGSGAGYVYRVRTNTATASGAITIELYDSIKVALSATSVGNLYISAYDNVAQSGANTPVVGVAVVPTTAATAGVTQYFWIQTKGMACIKRSGNIAAGQSVVPAASGAFAVGAAHTDLYVGYSLVAETSDDLFAAVLQLP